MFFSLLLKSRSERPAALNPLHQLCLERLASIGYAWLHPAVCSPTGSRRCDLGFYLSVAYEHREEAGCELVLLVG